MGSERDASYWPDSAYRSPWWLPGGNLQTIYAPLLGRRGSVRLERERWATPDGDFIDIDRLAGNARAPLVVLFHGLEGSSRSHYALEFMRSLARRGWRGAVPHFRGCSGEPNRLPRAYHSGDSDEIDWMLRRFGSELGAGPLLAAGVSLGGNALLKWLGEQGERARSVVAAAAALSAPLDLMAAGDALGRGFNLLYTRVFLATLKSKSAKKLVQYPGVYDAAALARANPARVRRHRHCAAARVPRHRRLLDALQQQAVAVQDRRADPADQCAQRSVPARTRAPFGDAGFARGAMRISGRRRACRIRHRAVSGTDRLAGATYNFILSRTTLTCSGSSAQSAAMRIGCGAVGAQPDGTAHDIASG